MSVHFIRNTLNFISTLISHRNHLLLSSKKVVLGKHEHANFVLYNLN